MTATVLAVASQKGGVGKSTTVRNLGANLAAAGQRVLMVDCDHQGALTFLCGPGGTPPETLYDLLAGYAETSDLPPGGVGMQVMGSGLHLIPADVTLANADMEWTRIPGWEGLLRDVLAPKRALYDWIILDTPPSLGVLTVNALVAADQVVIPVPAKVLDARGLDQLVTHITRLSRRLNKGLRIRGVVFTFAEPRLTIQRAVTGQVIGYCTARRIPILGSIRKATLVDQAAGLQAALRDMPDGNGVVDDYAALTATLLEATDHA